MTEALPDRERPFALRGPVSVCIPAYNEVESIGAVLEHVAGQDMPEVWRQHGEVLVCSNGSTDGTAAAVGRKFRELRGRGIGLRTRLILDPKPSKPNAWNRLFAEAKYDYLVFVDADVAFHEDAFRRLLRRLQGGTIAVGAVTAPVCSWWRWRERVLLQSTDLEPNRLICGRLYALDRRKVVKKFEAEGLVEMPTELIHEDMWLSLFLGPKAVEIALDVPVYYHQYSLTSKPIELRRSIRALRQLQVNYPDLYSEWMTVLRGPSNEAAAANAPERGPWHVGAVQDALTQGLRRLSMRWINDQWRQATAVVDAEDADRLGRGWETAHDTKTPVPLPKRPLSPPGA